MEKPYARQSSYLLLVIDGDTDKKSLRVCDEDQKWRNTGIGFSTSHKGSGDTDIQGNSKALRRCLPSGD